MLLGSSSTMAARSSRPSTVDRPALASTHLPPMCYLYHAASPPGLDEMVDCDFFGLCASTYAYTAQVCLTISAQGHSSARQGCWAHRSEIAPHCILKGRLKPLLARVIQDSTLRGDNLRERSNAGSY